MGNWSFQSFQFMPHEFGILKIQPIDTKRSDPWETRRCESLDTKGFVEWNKSFGIEFLFSNTYLILHSNLSWRRGWKWTFQRNDIIGSPQVAALSVSTQLSETRHLPDLAAVTKESTACCPQSPVKIHQFLDWLQKVYVIHDGSQIISILDVVFYSCLCIQMVRRKDL